MGSEGSGSGWFSSSEESGVADFWRVYEANFEHVFAELIASANEQAELANVVRSMSPDETRELMIGARGRVGRALHGAPAEYETSLRREAAEWARHGVGFAHWPVIYRVIGDTLRPLLIAEYAASPARLDAALRAYSTYLERSMAVLGAAYIEAKENALRETEARKAAILDATLDAIVTMAHDSVIVEFNPAATQMFGIARAEAVGRSVEIIIPPRLRRAHHAGLAKYLATGEGKFIGRRVEVSAVRGDGTEFPAEIAVVRIAGGGPPIFTAFIRDISEAQRAREETLTRKNELQALAARLRDAREEESRRIAREVHDVLGQSLTAMKLDVGWLAARLGNPVDDDSRPMLIERCQSLLDMVDETTKSVRRIASELRPAALDDLGLEAALEWQAREFQRRTGIRVTLDLPKEELPLDRDRATALFRVAQEALTNVARHAAASNVELSVNAEGEEVVLVVRDDGRGIAKADTSKSGALGIVGMRERAALLGGSLAVEGAPGAGTTVIVRLALAGTTEDVKP